MLAGAERNVKLAISSGKQSAPIRVDKLYLPHNIIQHTFALQLHLSFLTRGHQLMQVVKHGTSTNNACRQEGFARLHSIPLKEEPKTARLRRDTGRQACGLTLPIVPQGNPRPRGVCEIPLARPGAA